MASSQSSDVTSKTEGAPPAASNPGGSDGLSLTITSHKLNGDNYLQWSQSVMMYICGKGKDEYLTGEIEVPNKDDPRFKVWKTENHMVMSWLINSMHNEIGENFLLYQTAKDIWDAANVSYSSSENTSELFKIEGKLHDLRQGSLSVSQYYNSLSRYWQQLDMFESPNWKCPDDALQFKKIVDQKRTFKFLLGLNQNLDEVRGRVMGTKPLPSVREAFSEVRHEESRKKLMMGSHSTSDEGSAFTIRGVQDSQITGDGTALAMRGIPGNSNQDSNTQRRRGRPWCHHCRKPGHLRETCWKIHGKPPNWKPSHSSHEKEGRANSATTSDDHHTTTESSPFSKEQLKIPHELFSKTGSTTGTSMLAQKGIGFGEDDWQC